MSSEAPTRIELFEELIDARDEQCFSVKYKTTAPVGSEVIRDNVIVFEPTKDAARARFNELASDEASIVAIHPIE